MLCKETVKEAKAEPSANVSAFGWYGHQCQGLIGTEGAPGLIKQEKEQVEEMIRGFQKRTKTLGPEEGIGHSEKYCLWMGSGESSWSSVGGRGCSLHRPDTGRRQSRELGRRGRQRDCV